MRRVQGWDPVLIVSQIICLQTIHYLLLLILTPPILSTLTDSSILDYSGGPFRVGWVLDWREMGGKSTVPKLPKLSTSPRSTSSPTSSSILAARGATTNLTRAGTLDISGRSHEVEDGDGYRYTDEVRYENENENESGYREGQEEGYALHLFQSNVNSDPNSLSSKGDDYMFSTIIAPVETNSGVTQLSQIYPRPQPRSDSHAHAHVDSDPSSHRPSTEDGNAHDHDALNGKETSDRTSAHQKAESDSSSSSASKSDDDGSNFVGHDFDYGIDQRRAWLIGVIWLIVCFFDIIPLYFLIRKPTLILDFSLTLLFLHTIITTIHTRSFPTSPFYWLISAAGAVVMIVGGEQVCVGREMKEELEINKGLMVGGYEGGGGGSGSASSVGGAGDDRGIGLGIHGLGLGLGSSLGGVARAGAGIGDEEDQRRLLAPEDRVDADGDLVEEYELSERSRVQGRGPGLR